MLTPSKPVSSEDFDAALLTIQRWTLTLDQAEKLVRAITIEDEQSDFAPDVDDMADKFYMADQAHYASLDRDDEEPYMGATIGREDQPDWGKL
jgi:hypothetical protein